MLPSEFWQTAEELADDYRGAHKFWLQMPFQAIESLAAQQRSPPVCCHANRNKYAAGMYSIAIELVFVDGEVWIARLTTNHYDQDTSPTVSTSMNISCEVATLRLVKERTSIPVPTVFAFSETARNSLGWPYVLMSAIIGRTALQAGIERKFDDAPILPEKQALFDRYCRSLARIHLQLSRVSSDRIGSIYVDGEHPSGHVIGPDVNTGISATASSADYYAALRNLVMRDALRSGNAIDSEDRMFGVWLIWLMLSTAAFESTDGPYLLTHQDLHAGNTIVDEEGEIIGVLDWDTTAFLPIEIFATEPDEFFNDTTVWKNREMLSWFTTFNEALRAEEDISDAAPHLPDRHALSELHRSTIVHLINTLYMVMEKDPDIYASAAAIWEPFCRHLLGVTEFDNVRQSPVYKEWLSSMISRRS